MGLLAGTSYDPSTAASISTAAAQAMTAIDTSNLRLTFTAPAGPLYDGTHVAVRVRQRGVLTGATTQAQVLFGILDGSTVKARQAPFTGSRVANTNKMAVQYCSYLVGGLTPGTSYTWDAALGVETAVASTNLRYGGPNNATTNDAFGAFVYEIYDTPGLLGFAMYDPGTAVTKSVGSLQAMTALDTTNLRITFNAPPSGNVATRMQSVCHGAAGTNLGIQMGILDSSTVRGRAMSSIGSPNNTAAATDFYGLVYHGLITGLTAGTSYNFDAAWGVEVIQASMNIVYGGPDDTTADNAFGGFAYEIYDAGSVIPPSSIV